MASPLVLVVANLACACWGTPWPVSAVGLGAGILWLVLARAGVA